MGPLPGPPASGGPAGSGEVSSSRQKGSRILSVYKVISWLHPGHGVSLASVKSSGRHVTDLAVDTGTLDPEGRLSFSDNLPSDQQGSERWRGYVSPGARLFPHITNADETAAGLEELLGSAAARRRTAENLLALAREGGWAGISLDIRGPAPGQRDNLSALVEETAWMLHGAELELLFTAQARTMDPDSGTTVDGEAMAPVPRRWADLYDYQTLGIYADTFVMGTWQLPGGFRPDDRPDDDGLLARPRAAAAWGWLNTCLEYAMDSIPPRSLVLGLPFYGLKWREEKGRWRCLGPVSSADPGAAGAGLRNSEGSIRGDFDDLARSRVITTPGETVYYDDAETLAARAALVKEHHLAGVGFWRLGMETPSMWRAVVDLAV